MWKGTGESEPSVPFTSASRPLTYLFPPLCPISLAKYNEMLRNFARFLPVPATYEILLPALSPPTSRPFSTGFSTSCPHHLNFQNKLTSATKSNHNSLLLFIIYVLSSLFFFFLLRKRKDERLWGWGGTRPVFEKCYREDPGNQIKLMSRVCVKCRLPRSPS